MRRANAWLNGWTLVAGLLLAWLIIHMIGEARPTRREVPLSALARSVAEGKIASLTVQGDLIVAAPIDGMEQASVASRKEPGVGVAEALRTLGVPQEALSQLEIEVAPAGPSGALSLALGALPTLLIIGLAIWLARRGPRQADNPITSARQSGVQVTRNSRTRWADVAGAEAAKLELGEIVEFLKDPERFRRLGARVPRGVLLSGEPGTGKTLLARAVAGEAGVPFFYLSGSQFVEVFVGVGAARVRDLFQKAREAAPAIVFIDEIDAVGRRRGLSISAGHDEREQTLNQILVEMDGFEERTNVIVIAATNRVDVLDPALLRPGRFDRRIHVDLPDVNERRAILAVHARGKPFAGDVDLTRLARDTAGFSGADLANLLNEAAIFAAREHRLEISQCDLEEAVDRLAQGPRRTRAVSEVERRLAAVHEAGHAVVGALTGAGRVVKVTLVPRGPAGGYTRLDQDDRSYRSQSEFENALAWMMGGRAAERLVLGETSTGSAGDLEQATNLARAMVTRFGMSRLVGPVSAGALSGHHEAASEGSNELVESEVRRLLQEAERRAEQFLTENRQALDRLTERLLERETVYGPEVDEIVLGGRNEKGATRTATA